MLLLADVPIAKASRLLRCNEKALVSILHHWVGKAVAEDDLSKVRQISIDETSFKKGQSYVTVVIDAERHRVIDVEIGRDEQTVHAFSERLEDRGGDSAGIVAASSDMAKAYRAAYSFAFPMRQKPHFSGSIAGCAKAV